MASLPSMKKMSYWFFKNPAADGDSMNFAIAFLRIFSGLMMIPYGWGKVERYETLKENFFGDPIGIGDEASLIVCIFQQIFCAIMLVLGLQSRFAALMLFANMAVAVKFHFFDPFCAVKALPTLFLGMYAFLVISGGGRFSLDNLIFGNCNDALPCARSRHYAARIALMSGVFCISWVVFGNIFNLGGVPSAILLLAAFAIFLASVYGFTPQNNICGRRGK
jgi:hypothetical protein